MVADWIALAGGVLACLALSAGAGASAAEGPSMVVAQAGSYGGTIGKQDKSVSGSEAEPAPSRRREAPVRRSPGNSYDGSWTVQSTGQNCIINTSAAVLISGGRVIAQGATGTVSPSGAVRTAGAIGGITVAGQGQLSGRSGSGVFRQSDGCVGRWIATKQ